MRFFVLKNLDPKRQSKNLWFQSTTKSKIERSRLRFVWKTDLNLRLRLGPVNEEKSLVNLIFFESLFFFVCFVFCIFVFPSQSGQINTELKNNTILLSFKKELFGAKKNSFNFLARKMIVSFFWLQSTSICCFTNFWGNLKFVLKRMKVFYDRYETLLHVVLL